GEERDRYAPTLLGQFLVTQQREQNIAALTSKLVRDHAADVVDDANTELKANQLIEVSRNKLDYSAEQRMAALKEHNRIKNEQLIGDIQLAKDDLAAFDQRIKLERKNGELMEEDITKRAQLEAALIKVQSDASSARTGFLKLEKALFDEIHQDKINVLNDQYEKEFAAAQQAVEDKIQLVRDEVVAGKKLKSDGDKEIANIVKANTANLIQAQIDGLQTLMDATETNAEEDAEIAKRIANLKIDLNKAVYDSITTLDTATVVSAKLTVEKLEGIYREFASSITNLFSSISDRRVQGVDSEIAALEEKTERELELAGDNDAEKEKIELRSSARREQLEAKKKQIQTKSAQTEKALALFQAFIDGRAAVVAGLKEGGPVLAALYGVIAAINVAAIAAKPIPQFFKGTDNSPEGLAMVGEKGAELKIEPSGNVSLTPSVPTLDYLQAGTKIIPHNETMKMLALSGLGKDVMMQREQNQQVDLAKSLKQIEKNTRKLGKSTSSGNLFKQGILTYEQKIKEDKSREYIRRSNLGY
ncbi:MAG: hypothetical protein KW793_04720, partial [Candidatus Doudnabacteria bacterium]|nr:hypothetical protein [Candidatus Doudnabacteria bacterium]